MDRDEILERVSDVMSDVLGVAVADITPATQLEVDLEIEPHQRVEVAELLEDEFDVEVALEDVMEAHTVSELVDLLEDLTHRAG